MICHPFQLLTVQVHHLGDRCQILSCLVLVTSSGLFKSTAGLGGVFHRSPSGHVSITTSFCEHVGLPVRSIELRLARIISRARFMYGVSMIGTRLFFFNDIHQVKFFRQLLF